MSSIDSAPVASSASRTASSETPGLNTAAARAAIRAGLLVRASGQLSTTTGM
jgi:hypothetical protein